MRGPNRTWQAGNATPDLDQNSDRISKKLILKKKAADDKTLEKITRGQRVKTYKDSYLVRLKAKSVVLNHYLMPLVAYFISEGSDRQDCTNAQARLCILSYCGICMWICDMHKKLMGWSV